MRKSLSTPASPQSRKLHDLHISSFLLAKSYPESVRENSE